MADKTVLAFDEIKEEIVATKGEERRLCDRCIPEFHEIYSIAFYLCFTCSKYFCVECFRNHDTNHNFVSKECEQREIDSAIAITGNERDIVENEKVSVCDRVYVKHEFDEKNCAITGLCGADNRMWVACDRLNYCIKIYRRCSNVLLRYIRIGSKPYDVTEIQLKQNSTDSIATSNSSSGISGKSRTEPDNQCLLAVTIPKKRRLLFIDINKNPAFNVRCVPMEKNCYEIEYSDHKLFTVCREVSTLYRYRWFVYMMSTDGIKLSVIPTGICGIYIPNLAVLPGKVYLTDYANDKVKCINMKGRVLSQMTMERLRPGWICVDPDNNVYVCAGYPYNLFKLDLDLTGPPRPLLDLNTDYIIRAWALYFYRGQMFVSHGFGNNIVSVIRLV